ncbi:hypothetical protein IW261DRAFT_1559053 [Armillaria novae-zelandiae]|uniref:Zn(2)-C6 fungal-type domain-containing protein n=1 Tax=Armillaria novae-zelandiae TaxID=153914 RepID=A0AA39UDW3_9AGAR|nr:hypothetical protein IW261DRAFT_1559053 [Armillaria novae-zelandiae]
MAQPTDPQELSVVIAQDRYETTAFELRKLLAALLPEDADVSTVNLWVIDAKVHWESCTQHWRQAKVTSLEWHKLEYKLLEVFSRVPDDLVAYSCMEYNELAKHVLQFSMDVVPVPLSQMPAQPSVPKESTPSTAPHGPRTATLASVSSVLPARSVSRSSIIPPSLAFAVSQLPKASSLVRPHPILNKSLSTIPADALSSAAIFHLDSDSPLHPRPSSLPGPGVTESVAPSEGSIRSSWQLLVVNAASRPQVLPGPNPTQEGSGTFLSCGCMPLFFPGTDDEDEPPTPGAIDKGKGKEIVPGTEDDEDEFPSQAVPPAFMVIDEEDSDSPPPTNTARRLCSPVVASGSAPITVSEVRPHLSIHQADPNSVFFKLLGAPAAKKSKKGSLKKSKFDNPPPAPNNSATEGTMKASRSSKKGSKGKETAEVAKGGVVATQVHHPRGSSRIRPPLAAMGVQGGGFSEEVTADYKAIENGLKTIGVLVVSWDFGDFVEVDKALWNKKVAPFVGEQYVQPCDQCHHKKTQCCKFLTNSVLCVRCHYAKLPCHVNKVPVLNPLQHYRPQAYKSINAFDGAMDTLEQYADSLEDIVINYMAGIDTLMSDSNQAEEVVEEGDAEGYDADEVAEGEPGPSRKHKWSGR